MTRPTRLSTMPGYFDFPPASDTYFSSNITSARPTTTAAEPSELVTRRQRIQATIRAAERSGINRMEGQSSRNSPESRRRMARIRAIQDEEMNRLQAVGHLASNSLRAADAQPSNPVTRTRPQAIPSERHLQRNRLRRQQEGLALSESIDTVQQAVERLNEASSNLSSLLDEPIPRMMSPDVLDRDYSGMADNNRRRAKRRKLDADPCSEVFNGFSYGYHGQVVPGALKMEIVSCDGGHFTDHTGHVRHYWPENVLRNDKSVYCTENDKCNIILRHQGETPFCLKKLVVKAPERGFTAPIQEGMIFVSMTSKDLLTRTAQYHLRETTPPSLAHPSTIVNVTNEGSRPATNRFTLYPEPYMSDHNEYRPPSRRTDYPAARNIPPPMANTRVIPRQRITLDVDLSVGRNTSFPLIDLGDNSTPPPRTISPPVPPLFNVTTDCDDHSGDEEEESSAATLADRYRRDRMPLIYTSSDDDEDGGLGHWVSRRPAGADAPSRTRRCRRRATPSRIELTGEPKDGDADSNRRLEILAPHARFFIEREKSMISIKFDPPVSGKFILLKLWSPAKDQNIDIQSIGAHGFAGPRFFPAIRMK